MEALLLLGVDVRAGHVAVRRQGQLELEGVDGIVLDRKDNIIGAVNERNAIVVVTKDRTVELVRNAVAATQLRNEGPLEFPTSPVIDDRTLCVTSSDGARRDNFPNAPGEGSKVSCLDEDLPVR